MALPSPSKSGPSSQADVLRLRPARLNSRTRTSAPFSRSHFRGSCRTSFQPAFFSELSEIFPHLAGNSGFLHASIVHIVYVSGLRMQDHQQRSGHRTPLAVLASLIVLNV